MEMRYMVFVVGSDLNSTLIIGNLYTYNIILYLTIP